jgi:hypothetical protein
VHYCWKEPTDRDLAQLHLFPTGKPRVATIILVRPRQFGLKSGNETYRVLDQGRDNEVIRRIKKGGWLTHVLIGYDQDCRYMTKWSKG